MSLSADRADATLNDALSGGTPFLWLHTGSPGADGTANVAQTSVPANIDRKAVSFAVAGNHATNIERRSLSNTAVSWSGAEIAAGQEITHFSIWSLVSAGQVEFIDAVPVPKTTGSDGVTIDSGDIEVALEVFAKPA
jgi:hypothetical protein